MKRILLIAITLLVFQSASAQWIRQIAPSGAGNLYSVFAINTYAVAASGWQGVLRTINGGYTWANPIPVGGVTYRTVHTAVTHRWYSMALNTAWYLQVGNPSGASLLCCHPDQIYSLNFYSAACGAAVGLSGKVVTTCDTGNTFQTASSGTPYTLFSIWFGGNATGCACGAIGTITCTNNGGATWDTVAAPTNQTLNGIHFPNYSVGYTVGNSGTILKTTNSGQAWTVVPSGVTNDLYGVFFLNSDTGYAVGTEGLILQTKNGGMQWASMNSGTTATLNSVHFPTPGVGWVVGDSAVILKWDESVGVISPSAMDDGIHVFPNPVTDRFTVYGLRFTGKAAFEIYNVVGEKVYSEQLQTSNLKPQTSIDVSQLAGGLYFLVVRGENGSKMLKFVKE